MMWVPTIILLHNDSKFRWLCCPPLPDPCFPKNLAGTVTATVQLNDVRFFTQKFSDKKGQSGEREFAI